MRRAFEIIATGAAAAGLLLLADRWLQPVPIPAGTAMLGGLVFLWLRRPLGFVGAGMLIGTLAGMTAHAVVHATGASTVPPEGVVAHVALDGGRGLGVAALLMAPALLLQRALERPV